MLAGERYRDGDPELVAMRRSCGRQLDRFNATAADDDAVRSQILQELLGGIGEGSWGMPRFQCVTIGRNSVIGAGSVVTRAIPDHVAAVGNPCRVGRWCSPWKRTECSADKHRAGSPRRTP